MRKSLSIFCILAASVVQAQDAQLGTSKPDTVPIKLNTAVTPSAVEIIDRSLSKYRDNLTVQRNYLFRQREVSRQLDKDGNVKKTEIRTYEVSMPCGIADDWYEKLVAKEDKPLSESDQKKQNEKLDKYCAEQKKHHEEYQRELDKWKQKHANDGQQPPLSKDERDEREIADGIKKVYDFHLEGEDQIDGREVYVISAEPRPAYKPDKRWEHLLAKMRGKLWIDAADFQIVKAEADLFDDFHVGLFLFKLNKGAHFEFEQTRINQETWLPSREFLKGSGKVAFFTGRFQQNTTYSDYQKFRTDTKITGIVSDTVNTDASHQAGRQH
ncbi:MAG TPA: hypothetical protein VKW78_14310 [Terriglobales bacterium]|nr:hypothetical protein [Terriglobales bacterium]